MKKPLTGFSLTLLALPVLAQIDPNRVVAIVNGEEIKGNEYYRRLETLDLREGYSRFGDRMFSYPAGFVALDQLIQERVLLQLAKEKGALPSDVEIKAELDNAIADDAELQKGWERSGKTLAELTQRMRLELTGFKLQTFGINVTDLEVEKFYKDNPNQFTVPKLYKLRVIVLADKTKKAAVDADLAAGVAFADAAKKHSDDLSKATGGDYGATPLDRLPEVYSKPISETRVGATTAWIESDTQAVRFLLESVTPEKLLELDAKAKRGVRRQLMLDRGRVKNDVNKEIGAKLASSKIQILIKEFAEPYAKMLEQTKNPIVKPAGSGG